MQQDYLRSNETRAAEVKPRIEELKQLANRIEMTLEERAENTAAIEAFYVLEPSYIDATRAEATKRFGDLNSYIEKGLNQSEGDLQTLRNIMLE